MRQLSGILTLLAGAASAAAAQSGGTISGIARDSASNPVAGAEVVARPSDHRTRSDSLGRFTLSGLEPRSYKVVARKFGYSPDEFSVSLGKDGHANIQLTLGRIIQLDTV